MEGSQLVQSTLQAARAQRALGRYADAVATLVAGPGSSSNSRLAIEIVDTWFMQGLVKRAYDLLESLSIPDEPTGSDDVTALQILRAFHRFQVSARFRDELAVAGEVLRSTFRASDKDEVTESLLRADSYYCSFLVMTRQCGSLKEIDTCFDDSSSRIKRAFYRFSERRDLYNALRAARAHYQIQEQDSSLLWEFNRSCDSSTSLCVAEAQYALAETLKDDSQNEPRNQLYEAASTIFSEAGHVHRPLDIRIKRTCLGNLNTDDVTDDTIPQLIREYQLVDHPTGRVALYLALSELATRLYDRDMQTKLLIEIEESAKLTGSLVVWILSRFGNLARYASTLQYSGQLIRSGVALWNDLVGSDCSTVRGTAAKLVAEAYFYLKSPTECEEWTSKANQDIENLITEVIPKLPLEDAANLENILRDTQAKVEALVAQRRIEAASQKCEELANHVLSRNATGPSYFDTLDDTLKLTARVFNLLPENKTKTRRKAYLRKSEAAMLLRKGTSYNDVTYEDEALAILIEAKDLYYSIGLYAEAATVLQQQALVNVSKFQKLEIRQDEENARPALEEALRLYRIVLDTADKLGMVFLARDNAYWVSHCQYRQWERSWASGQEALNALRLAETYVDLHRHEMSTLKRLEAAHAKRLIQADLHNGNIYMMAIHIADRQGWLEELWNWIQKSKARSLSDLLGLGIFVPRELEDRIRKDDTTKELFEAECTLLDADSVASDADQLPIRDKLNTIRTRMRSHAVLQELLVLREGSSITLQDLCNMPSGADTTIDSAKIIHVDWFINVDAIFLIVVGTSHEITITRLNITVGEIKSWISTYLTIESTQAIEGPLVPAYAGLIDDDDDEWGPLRQLDPLVAPLGDLTNTRDLLVFCPSKALHAIPLHALRVGPKGSNGRQVLIERNPVVYAASLTSFTQSCDRANNSQGVRDVSKSSFLAVYEASHQAEITDEISHSQEQENLYSATMEIAREFGGTSHVADMVTRDRFIDAMGTSSFVNFLGHCDFNTPEMSEQSLQLFSSGGDVSAANFTVRDIFDTTIHSALVSIIGCGTASQLFQAGDEPLGLVTALLTAGASSVVGTLWPVETSTAVNFTRSFFKYLRSSDNQNATIYNFACAMRGAVLDLRHDRDRRTPYHWGSFVLHGSWYSKKTT